MYLQRSILHRHQLSTKIERETALANERQMEIQHRLYRSEQKDAYDEGRNQNHSFDEYIFYRFMFTCGIHAFSFGKCY